MEKIKQMNNTEKATRRARNAGFTLVELLLVVAILGVLATVAIMNTQGLGTEARIRATQSSIKTIETALKSHEIRNGKYPDTLDQLTVAESGSIVAPPLKKSDLIDSFGNKFDYRKSGNTFEIISAGPDGQMNTSDDIKSGD